ncbi:polysaccharide biosynthesis tyrosine autokinase [Tersicoccus solisilvae]|uniref:polysaccharide biosynthesis tyrosine autokinase n=1 Tax=Tersicoccus solisilvae TaxID=1882339 RepID=UPI0016698924|nr:polysaccharide biosynthesis tyrosine autokinase [Tersicoccus solisilvae]
MTRLIKRYWVPVVLLMLLGGFVAGLMAMATPDSFRATSKLFVSTQRGQSVQELVQGSTFSQDQVLSYAELATAPVVLDPVRAQLGLDSSAAALGRQIEVNVPLNTVVIEVSAVSGTADQAARLSNAVSDSLAREVERLAPLGPKNEASVVLNKISPAEAPRSPFAPDSRLYVLIGMALGAGLALLYAVAREVLDTRIQHDADIARVADTPVLANLARLSTRRAVSSVMLTDPQSSAAESYRLLRTNLEFMEVDGSLRTLVVTSPSAGEGKTTTALGLALAIAESGVSVLLVDADLRRPGLAGRLQIDAGRGLSSMLIGQATLDQAVVHLGKIDVLPAGPVPPNPNQLLNSAAAESLIAELGARYDIVVMDTAPLLPVTDTLPLSKLADGTIVVIRSGHTRRPQLRSALESLNTIHARVLGVALNRVRVRKRGAYYVQDTGTPRRRPATEVGPQQQRHRATPPAVVASGSTAARR